MTAPATAGSTRNPTSDPPNSSCDTRASNGVPAGKSGYPNARCRPAAA